MKTAPAFQRIDLGTWGGDEEGAVTTYTSEVSLDRESLKETFAEDEKPIDSEEVEAVLASFTACEL